MRFKQIMLTLYLLQIYQSYLIKKERIKHKKIHIKLDLLHCIY